MVFPLQLCVSKKFHFILSYNCINITWKILSQNIVFLINKFSGSVHLISWLFLSLSSLPSFPETLDFYLNYTQLIKSKLSILYWQYSLFIVVNAVVSYHGHSFWNVYQCQHALFKLWLVAVAVSVPTWFAGWHFPRGVGTMFWKHFCISEHAFFVFMQEIHESLNMLWA